MRKILLSLAVAFVMQAGAQTDTVMYRHFNNGTDNIAWQNNTGAYAPQVGTFQVIRHGQFLIVLWHIMALTMMEV